MKTNTEIIVRTCVFSGSMVAIQLLAAKMPDMGMLFSTIATIFLGINFLIYIFQK